MRDREQKPPPLADGEIEQIASRALAEADAGDFASDAEVEAVFAKWCNCGRRVR